MCGVIGAIERGGNAPQLVFEGLKEIDFRGYDSWGIALQGQKGLEIAKTVGKLPESFTSQPSQVSIGHTRWATHGGVTIANSHPHLDCKGKLALVHNGIVENYHELKNEVKSHGFKSETDTEVIIHLIEDQLKAGQDLFQATAYSFNSLRGLNAILVTDGKDIIGIRKGSPLVLAQLPTGYAFSSDPNALSHLTDNFYFPRDNQLVKINCNEANNYLEKPSYLDGVDEPNEIQFLKNNIQYIKIGNKSKKEQLLKDCPYWLYKEIKEQPGLLARLSLPEFARDSAYFAQELREKDKIIITGSGSAYYAALAGQILFSQHANRLIYSTSASEGATLAKHLTPQDAILILSQSGETIDTIDAVDVAQKSGAAVFALTNTYGSSLYRAADHNLMLGAGREKAVLASKSFSAMLARLTQIATTLGEKPLLGELLLGLGSLGAKDMIQSEGKIKTLAQKLAQKEHIYILGRGISYPIALESALKIKEGSYIHAEGFAGGELKHGVMALIEKGTPVIGFVPNDETKDLMVSNLKEVQSRGAYTIGVANEPSDSFSEFFPSRFAEKTPIPSLVFAQLLGYHLALQRGINPDKPRNLAKSVTVR